MNKQRGFSTIEGLLILVIAALIGGVGWYVWDSSNKTENTLNNADQSNNTSAVSRRPTVKEVADSPEKEAIKQTLTKECEAEGPGSKVNSITVVRVEGDFATAFMSCVDTNDFGPEHRRYMKKTNGVWATVVTGSGAPTSIEELKPHGFPSDYLD